MADIRVNLDLSNEATYQANLTAYYNTIRPYGVNQMGAGDIIVTVNLGQNRNLIVTMEQHNLQVSGVLQRNVGGNVTVENTTYNRLGPDIQVNKMAMKRALEYFYNHEEGDAKTMDDRKNFVVLVFFLSEAAHAETSCETARMAADLEAYIAARAVMGVTALTPAQVGARFKWDSHSVILSNRSVMTPAGADNVTVANMRLYCVVNPNGTSDFVTKSLDAMGF